MGKLYIGNLGENTKSLDLEKLFAGYGKVKWAEVATDPATGKSKGFGFVQMDSDDESRRAVAGINGRGLDGHLVKVSQAKPRQAAAKAAKRPLSRMGARGASARGDRGRAPGRPFGRRA